MWSFAPRRVSHMPARCQISPSGIAGDEDFVGLARGHEPIDEDFSRRRNRHVIDGVAQGAFQHHGPEPPHGVFRLLLAAEPLAHGGRVGRVGSAMTGQSPHGPADCPALAAREVTESPQPGHEMQRRRQPAAGGEIVTPAVGAEEMQRRVAIETVGGFRAAAEIQEVRAATHGHVRRKIDELIGLDVVIRAGPAARASGPARTIRRGNPAPPPPRLPPVRPRRHR